MRSSSLAAACAAVLAAYSNEDSCMAEAQRAALNHAAALTRILRVGFNNSGASLVSQSISTELASYRRSRSSHCSCNSSGGGAAADQPDPGSPWLAAAADRCERCDPPRPGRSLDWNSLAARHSLTDRGHSVSSSSALPSPPQRRISDLSHPAPRHSNSSPPVIMRRRISADAAAAHDAALQAAAAASLHIAAGQQGERALPQLGVRSGLLDSLDDDPHPGGLRAPLHHLTAGALLLHRAADDGGSPSRSSHSSGKHLLPHLSLSSLLGGPRHAGKQFDQPKSASATGDGRVALPHISGAAAVRAGE